MLIYFKASLDVDFLFTEIPLNETIDVCIDNLYSNTEIYKGIAKRKFKTLLETASDYAFYFCS